MSDTDMYPRVRPRSSEESILEGDDDESMDIEALAQLFQEDPGALTADELARLPDAVFDGRDPNGFMLNLAESLGEDVLSRIASDISGWVTTDLSSREGWQNRMLKGMAFLGVNPEHTLGGAGDPEDGYSRVVHPGIQEARVQFQARAMAEVWPAGGPVNAQVLGAATPEVNAQACRVKQYLNYLYMHRIPYAYHCEDKNLYQLPLAGSTFKKLTANPITGEPEVRLISYDHFVVPADAQDLETAPRYTEIFEETGNETLRKMLHGVYRKTELSDPAATATERTEMEMLEDLSDGVSRVNYDGDQSYRRYECYLYMILPGDEDVGVDGEPTGLAKPYIITMDADDQKVLSIYRGWREGDPYYIRRVFHNHYRFLPGDGFYGHGFFHAIGGLAETATGTLRALMDSALLHNLQGGITAFDLDVKGGSFRRKPGEWIRTRASAEELQQGFHTIPTHEPSSVLMQLLTFVSDGIQRFASTTDIMVGDAAASGPVGTTLAQIEQGSKVYTGIHKRLHEAHAREYKMLAELVSENIPQGGYPYALPEGVENTIMADDFNSRIDVIPVSDPNIVSQGQRIVRANATLMLASQYAHLHDMREVVRRTHLALGNADVDALMPPPQESPTLDPMGEVMAIMNGSPVQAGPDQDHQAHANFLRNWFQTLEPDHQKQFLPAYHALLFSHMALAYKQQIEAQTGQAAEGIPPEQLAQMPLSPVLQNPAQQQQEMESAEAQHRMALDAAKVDADIARKGAKTEADIAQRGMAAEADVTRKDAQAAFQGDLTMMSATADTQRRDYLAQQQIMLEARQDGGA